MVDFDFAGSRGRCWRTQSSHRNWLLEHAERLFAFYEQAVNPTGGFHDLDDDGRPLPTGWPPAPKPVTNLFQTTRMVHCFAIAHLMGRPGSADIVDHGMRHLWDVHRDRAHGGYVWQNAADGSPLNDTKQHYGHAFVLLAASSAKVAGHPDADRLLGDISEVLDRRFWEPAHGAGAEEFSSDWQPLGAYRGQNSNMHLTEALMAAYEATGERVYLDRAAQVADLLINRITRANGWRLPEHFHADWSIDFDYDRDVFRPYGSTIGHWLEWTRLLLQLWELGGRTEAWIPEAARTLFDRSIADGWDRDRGGFYFTVGWDGQPVDRDRYWWPATEGIGAAAFLGAIDGGDRYETWYRRIWDWSTKHLIDHRRGGWYHQLDDRLNRIQDPWYGKPDIYHSLQACLIPLLPTDGSVTAGLVKHGI